MALLQRFAESVASLGDSAEPLLGYGDLDTQSPPLSRLARSQWLRSAVTGVANNYAPVATTDSRGLRNGAASSAPGISIGAGADVGRGCIPCTNSFVVVPQDRRFAFERFGKFESILGPGLHVLGFDICGLCIGLRSVTSRIVQHIASVHTFSSDKVSVVIQVAVQHSVNPEYIVDAMYRMADVEMQLDSHIADIVRTKVTNLTLDQAFEEQHQISDAVRTHLAQDMDAFGLFIHSAQIVGLEPDQEVTDSMNNICAQRLNRQVVQAQAEGNRISVVKSAEGAADVQALQGQGTARYCSAVIQGLRETLGGEHASQISNDHVADMFALTQYFQTLKNVAAGQDSEAVFILKQNHKPQQMPSMDETPRQPESVDLLQLEQPPEPLPQQQPASGGRLGGWRQPKKKS